MKKSEVKVGHHYLMKVSGNVVTVRVDAIREVSGYGAISGRSKTVCDCTNTATGRKCSGSPAKLRCRANDPNSAMPIPQAKKKMMTREELGLDMPSAAKKAEAEQRPDPQQVGKAAAGVACLCAIPEVRTCPAHGSRKPSATPTTRSSSSSTSGEEGEQRSPFHAGASAPVSSVASAAAPAAAPAAKLNGAAPTAPSAASTPLATMLRRSIETVAVSDTAPHLIVEARAGSGKTTTLVEGLKLLKGLGSKLTPSPQQQAVWDAICLSRETAKSVCFVAFNKSIATELQARVPQGCDAMTMHSLGFRAVQKALGRCDVNGFTVSDIIGELTGKNSRDMRRDNPVLLTATEQLVSLCKMNLVRTWDRPAEDIAEDLDRLAGHYEVDLNGSRQRVFELVPKVMERCREPKGRVNFDDMIWLPVALNLPVYQYDLLLVDEAQDLNRCQQALARKAGKRLILVGDSKQAIYGFCHPAGTPIKTPGGLKLIEEIGKGEPIIISNTRGDVSGWNGRKVVQDTFVYDHNGPLVTLTTRRSHLSGYSCEMTPHHRVPVKISKVAKFYTYMMVRAGVYRVGHCAANTTERFMFSQRCVMEKADFGWLLQSFENRAEAVAAENELLLRIKGTTFHDKSDEQIAAYPSETEAAMKILTEHGRLFDFPMWIKGERQHFEVNVPFIAEACNVMDDMRVAVWADSQIDKRKRGRGRQNFDWTEVEVTRRHFAGKVYGISVPAASSPRNEPWPLYFAGDGILVHNSGADAESMDRMGRELAETPRGCVKVPLTVTRRCGKAIVAEANRIVPDFDAHESNPAGKITEARYPRDGVTWEQSYGPTAKTGDMVLCRVNAPLVSQCFQLLKRRVKAQIQGRDIGAGLISTVKKSKADTVVQLVAWLSDWLNKETAKEQAKRNPSDTRLIALQDRADCLICFTDGLDTCDAVVKRIESVFTDDKTGPGVKLSSIHKAKGLEAQRVFFINHKDAPCPHPMAKSAWQHEQELNLLYVGITRAIEELVWVR